MTELLHDIEKIKEEFHSIERPKLQIEAPIEKAETPLQSTTPSVTMKTISIEELDKSSEDDSAEEISEWECDALDKDQHTMS